MCLTRPGGRARSPSLKAEAMAWPGVDRARPEGMQATRVEVEIAK